MNHLNVKGKKEMVKDDDDQKHLKSIVYFLIIFFDFFNALPYF